MHGIEQLSVRRVMRGVVGGEAVQGGGYTTEGELQTREPLNLKVKERASSKS